MLTKIIAIVLVAIFAHAEIFPGPCRTVEELGGVKMGFNYVDYSGQWYEIERYDNFNQQNTDCNIARYLRTPTEPNFYNTIYSGRVLNGPSFSVPGIGRVSYPNRDPIPAKLNTTFTPGGAADQSNYWILSTDYINYSFVLSCAPVNATHRMEFYWLFGRFHPLTPEIRNRVDTLARTHLDVNRIRPTVQGTPCL